MSEKPKIKTYATGELPSNDEAWQVGKTAAAISYAHLLEQHIHKAKLRLEDVKSGLKKIDEVDLKNLHRMIAITHWL